MMIEAELRKTKNYQGYHLRLTKEISDDSCEEERKGHIRKLFTEIKEELKIQMEGDKNV